MRDQHQKQAFRDVQGARIARMIRESEAGWLFYGPGGEAFHIFADEAAALEREGLALVERALDPGFVPQPDWRVMLALVIALVMTGTAALPAALGSLVPSLLITVAFPAVLIYAAANDVAYEAAVRRWRRATAARLAAQRRGGVPDPIAAKHRRYNVFQMICVTGAIAYLVRVIMMMTGVIPEGFHPLDMAILAVTALASWPAQRVDATHRRRKWFD
jgi:hypothetical protein